MLKKQTKVISNICIYSTLLTVTLFLMQGCGGGAGSGFSSGNSVPAQNAPPGAQQVTPITTASFDLTTLNGSLGFKINGVRGSDTPGFSDVLGSAVSYAGDLNGDGKNDIFVAARDAEDTTLSAALNSGRGYVIFGNTKSNLNTIANGTNGFSVSLLNGANGVIIDNPTQGLHLGTFASGGGDYNGDGLTDLLLANNSYNTTSSVYSVYGDSGLGDGKSFQHLHNMNVLSLTGLSDLNGDAKDDGAIFGGFNLPSLNRISLNTNYAGDIDNDGRDDFLVGNANNSVNGTNAGETLLVFGASASSLDTHSTLLGDGSSVISFKGKANDYSGKFVTGVGDVNNDGIDDFAIGATTLGQDGKVFVIFGKTNRTQLQTLASSINSVGFQAALNGANGFVLTNAPFYTFNMVNPQMGDQIARLGDFNGDGIDDFAVSVPDIGAAIIIYGRSGSFTATVDAESITKTSVGGVAIAGGVRAIASAGDINADGKKDILIGASQGHAFVVFGRSQLTDFVSETVALAGYGHKFIDLTDGASFSGHGDLLLPGARLNGLGVRLMGPTNGDFGVSVAGLGDINGDGYDDVVIGDPMGRPATVVVTPYASDKAGQAFVFYGQRFD